MIIKSEFKADLFQLKHAAAPEVLLNELKDRAAIELGREIVKHFPFKKIDELSFKGEIPALVMNREHQYVDHYRSSFHIISEQDHSSLKAALIHIVAKHPDYSYLLSLIN